MHRTLRTSSQETCICVCACLFFFRDGKVVAKILAVYSSWPLDEVPTRLLKGTSHSDGLKGLSAGVRGNEKRWGEKLQSKRCVLSSTVNLVIVENNQDDYKIEALEESGTMIMRRTFDTLFFDISSDTDRDKDTDKDIDRDIHRERQKRDTQTKTEVEMHTKTQTKEHT